mmetsp:Transcript_110698/g.318205  ORF Transcript_110698/g.318205 Transcript_110698/m.318205 type:complete len:427 (+) Transcript_110698:728-2008(+)
MERSGFGGHSTCNSWPCKVGVHELDQSCAPQCSTSSHALYGSRKTTSASIASFPTYLASYFETRMDSTSGGVSRPVAFHKRANSRMSSAFNSSGCKSGKFLMRTSLRPPPRPQIEVAASADSNSLSSSTMSPHRGWSGVIILCDSAPPLWPAPLPWCPSLLSSASTLASRMFRDKSCPMCAARFRASSFSSRFAIQGLVDDAPGGAFRCNASASGTINGFQGRDGSEAECGSWCSWTWCSSSQWTLACKSSSARVRSFSALSSFVRELSIACSSCMSSSISRCRARWLWSSSSTFFVFCSASCRSLCAWICCIFSLMRAAMRRISFSSPSVRLRSLVSSKCFCRIMSSEGFAGDTCKRPPLFSSKWMPGGCSSPFKAHAFSKEASSSKSTKANPRERPHRLSTKRETHVTEHPRSWKKSPISYSSS